MFCVVVGLVPPDEGIADAIRKNVSIVDDGQGVPITWKASHSLAIDYEEEEEENDGDDDNNSNSNCNSNHAGGEKEGALTLLLTAIGDEPATPESVVAAVDAFVQDYTTTTDASSTTTDKKVSVELWASSGAPLPLCPLEGYERHIRVDSNKGKDGNNNNDNHQQSWSDRAALAMQEWGLVVQPQLVSATDVSKWKCLVDEAIRQVDSQLAEHRPDLVVGQDTFLFREIASRNQQRFDLRLANTRDNTNNNNNNEDDDDASANAGSRMVQEFLADSPQIRSFLKKVMQLKDNDDVDCGDGNSILDTELDFDLSVVYSRPGAGAQGWHADGDHTRGAPDAGWSINNKNKNHELAPPYAICLFLPLIDLNTSVGCTQFWPGSHAHRALMGFGPVAKVTQSVWDSSDCRAGDGVWYDYRLMHQGMPNTSIDVLRPVLQIIFKRKWYVETANYGVESIDRS